MTNVHKKRVEEIDILRGLAAILMVLGHSFIQYPVDISNEPWCVTIGHFIYTFHMELFFVLAGFVYHCTSYAGFMKKKVKRLLIPYLFFGIATMLLHAYGGAAINGIVPLGVGIRNLLLYGGGYWFLYTSFFMFACYPLIEKICAGMLGQIAVGIGCLALSQFVEIPSALMLGSVVFYLPYFIAGHCAAKLCKSGGGGVCKQIQGQKHMDCVHLADHILPARSI